MPRTRTYPNGVPCWIAAEEPDPDAAMEFYGALFGWTFRDITPPGAPVYYLAALDGADVGAITVARGDAVWSTFVATDDVDQTAAAFEAGGGAVLGEPRDAGADGRTAAVRDPQGAALRLWQAREHPGSQSVNVPGSWNFSDLRTADPDASKDFYSRVFGWRYHDFGPTVEAMIAVPGYGAHLAATADPQIYERQAGAPEGFADVIGAIEAAEPAEPTHWRVKFSVRSRADTAALVEKLGGTVLATDDQVWADLAHVRDPQGAQFTVSEFHEPR